MHISARAHRPTNGLNGTASAGHNHKLTSKQRKQQQEQELAARQRQQQATLPGVSTNGLAEVGFGDQARVINEETAKQDDYLDQISQGLDQLKAGAVVSQERAAVVQMYIVSRLYAPAV